MTTQLIDGHGLGAIPSHDARSLKYAAPRVAADIIPTLPARFTLAAYLTQIEDQGQEGSCTGHSASTAAEMCARIMGQAVTQLSRRDSYFYARKLWNGRTDIDEGAPLNTAADGVRGGLCTENTWKYVAGQFAQPPPPGESNERPQFQWLDRHQDLFANNSDHVLAIKAALNAMCPVVFGFSVYNDFYRTPQTGVMPATMTGQMLGGHAVTCWGYQDNAGYPGGGYFLIQNSWGRWTATVPDTEARPGDFLMPFACVQSQMVFEARGYVPKQAPPPPPPPPDGNHINRLAAIDAVTAALRALPAV